MLASLNSRRAWRRRRKKLNVNIKLRTMITVRAQECWNNLCFNCILSECLFELIRAKQRASYCIVYVVFCDLEAVISKEMLLSKMSNYRRAGISRRLIGAKVGSLLLFFSLSTRPWWNLWWEKKSVHTDKQREIHQRM